VARLFARWRHRVDFVAVYVSEAHARDGWRLYSDVCFDAPTTLAERVAIARRHAARLHGGVPLVVDGIDNAAEAAFSAWPERLYVVDADGRIGFKGGLGPDGYKPELAEAHLRKTFPRAAAFLDVFGSRYEGDGPPPNSWKMATSS